jgi:hypothetical protein
MTDIAELMGSDPLGFTKEAGEVKELVEKLRGSRSQFNLNGMKAAAPKKAVSAKAKAVAGLNLSGGLSLNLESLLNRGASPQKKSGE